ncbi:hypothetical protein YTPLAS18_00450 [Nitrospira sp.]|nr:hypothetical protein YTPLAS18_00450 [Nitrospira sp.]
MLPSYQKVGSGAIKKTLREDEGGVRERRSYAARHRGSYNRRLTPCPDKARPAEKQLAMIEEG